MANEEHVEPEVPEGQEPETPSAEELRGQLEAERTRNSQLVTRLDRLESMLIQRGVEGGDAEERAATREPARPATEPPNFEEMSTADLAKYVVQSVDQRLQAFSKDVDAKVSQATAKVEAQALVSEIAEAMETHEDLLEYQQPITQIMAENGKLSVEDAYYLAKRKAGKPISDSPSAKPAPESGVPPRGSRAPVAGKPAAQPASFEEAGRLAWKKLGMSE